MCSILCICLRKATNNFSFKGKQCLQQSIRIINQTLSRKEYDFSLDKIAEAKIKLLTADNSNLEIAIKQQRTETDNNSSTDESQVVSSKSTKDTHQCTPNSSIKPKTTTEDRTALPEESTTKNPTSNITPKSHKLTHPVSYPIPLPALQTALLKTFASAVLRPRRLLYGATMMQAVEVLRYHKTPNVYFASAEASNHIEAWRMNQPWKLFAKMFGNKDILENKLNGTYLFPIFSGASNGGHWSLCIIKKLGHRDIKGRHMDSLGSSALDENISRKIECAFAPAGRGRFIWIPCTSRRQEELECGPRTILAMEKIHEGINGNINIDDCIQSASLINTSRHTMTPAKIREKIAYLVNEFQPHMITPIIRFRSRNSNLRIRNHNQQNKEGNKKPKIVINLESSQSTT